MVERASGSRDDDVDAALEGAELLLHRLAAVDRQHARSHRSAIPVDRFGDLHRQLARGDEDQTTNRALVVCRRSDALHHREREGRRFAGACRGLPEHVAAREERRDGLALNIGRLLVAKDW